MKRTSILKVLILLSVIGMRLEAASKKALPPYRSFSYDLKDKITNVTTYSDRAKITRKASLDKLTKKSQGWVHFSALPNNVNKNSIRIKLLGNDNSIDQVLLEDSFEQVALDKSLKKKIKDLKSFYAQKLDLTQQKSLLKEKYYFVKNLLFSAPFAKSNYTYQRFNAPISQIGAAFDSTQENSQATLLKIEALNLKLKNINQEITYLNKHINIRTNISSQRWLTNIYVKLKKDISKNNIQLSYFIPNAWWYPVYDIRADLDLKRGRANIRLVSGGLVEQHTGEDWSDVKMLLSTLDPTPLYLPLLRKWSFSEVREEQVFPSSIAESKESLDKISSNSVKVSRSRTRPMKKSYRKKNEMVGQKRNNDEKISAAMDQENSPAVAVFEVEESTRYGENKNRQFKVKRNGKSLTNRSNLFPLSPLEKIYSNYSIINQKIKSLTSNKTRYRSHSILSQTKPTKNSYKSSRLPAVSANGRLIEMASPFNIDLKHDEEALKIPLNSQTLFGELTYLAIPKKDKRVFIRAKTKNTTAIPLLAGKAQVFMNGDLISKTVLSTISEGGYFTVELGIDRGIETQRLVKKRSEENGLVFKTHSTNVEVKIEISNSHNFPINITVKDHYPKSPNDNILINLKEILPAAKYKKHGYITWESKIGPNKKKVYTFNYNVTHPENYIVSEFN
jgi:hypothetical protein